MLFCESLETVMTFNRILLITIQCILSHSELYLQRFISFFYDNIAFFTYFVFCSNIGIQSVLIYIIT